MQPSTLNINLDHLLGIDGLGMCFVIFKVHHYINLLNRLGRDGREAQGK
jgi:hypothetical protein